MIVWNMAWSIEIQPSDGHHSHIAPDCARDDMRLHIEILHNESHNSREQVSLLHRRMIDIRWRLGNQIREMVEGLRVQLADVQYNTESEGSLGSAAGG